MKGNLTNKTPEFLVKMEHKMLKLICEEYTNEELSKELNLGYRSVESLRRKLMKKTKSKNVVGLLKYALKKKIYTIK